MPAQNRSIRFSDGAVAATPTEHGEPKQLSPQSLLFLLASSTTSAQFKPIAGFRLGGRACFIGHVVGPTHTPVHQPKTLSGVLFDVLIDIRFAAAAEALVLKKRVHHVSNNEN